MKKYKITGIGEVLWDMLPEGKQLGGAPGNFCFHTQNLGADATIISAIGKDESGMEIERLLNEKKLKLILNYPDFTTGYVSVKLENGMPSYTIHENVAWDHITLSNEAKEWIKKTDAICFGSLAQRSETSGKAIEEALKAAPEKALKVFDINLRQHYYNKEILEHSMILANVLKLNDDELEIISEMFNLVGSDKEKCLKLMQLFGLDLVALTLGSQGSWLFTQTEESFQQVPKIEIMDTIGAGDSFTATMVMGLLKNKPLAQLHYEATSYSAKVCTFSGATPKISPDSF
jgi:fructokinase